MDVGRNGGTGKETRKRRRASLDELDQSIIHLGDNILPPPLPWVISGVVKIIFFLLFFHLFDQFARFPSLLVLFRSQQKLR